MLEILRAVVTNCGETQRLIGGEADQVPRTSVVAETKKQS